MKRKNKWNAALLRLLLIVVANREDLVPVRLESIHLAVPNMYIRSVFPWPLEPCLGGNEGYYQERDTSRNRQPHWWICLPCTEPKLMLFYSFHCWNGALMLVDAIYYLQSETHLSVLRVVQVLLMSSHIIFTVQNKLNSQHYDWMENVFEFVCLFPIINELSLKQICIHFLAF